MNTINISNPATGKINYVSNNSIVISAIMASAIFIFQTLSMPSIVSILFYISIAMVGINYFLRITSTSKISVYVLVICVLMLLSFAISGFVRDFETYKRAIIVMCCIICIDDSRNTKLNLNEFRIIEYSFLATSYFAIIMFYAMGLRYVYYKDTYSVAMNFSNPNALALWITVFFIGIAICFFIESRKPLKILLLGAAVLLLPIISATESRNSYISCIFVIATLFLTIFRSKKKKSNKIPTILIIALIALPAIIFFAYMYIVIPNISFFEETFSFLLGHGKSLRSRADIWQNVINNLRPCLLFGKYNTFNTAQMHNSLMTLYCMFGAPITILISTVFYNSVKRKNIYSQIALIGIWSTGCFEASVFVGVAGIYLMLQILPAIGDCMQQSYTN